MTEFFILFFPLLDIPCKCKGFSRKPCEFGKLVSFLDSHLEFQFYDGVELIWYKTHFHPLFTLAMFLALYAH